MIIEKVSNGYIVDCANSRGVYKTLDEVFTYMLMQFEGRGQYLGGKFYGIVKIEREESKT